MAWKTAAFGTWPATFGAIEGSSATLASIYVGHQPFATVTTTTVTSTTTTSSTSSTTSTTIPAGATVFPPPPGLNCSSRTTAEGSDLRLSKIEYDNSLKELLPIAHAIVTTEIEQIPDEPTINAFLTEGLGITGSHVDSFFDISTIAAEYMTAETSRMGTIQNCLSTLTSTNVQSCVRSFVTNFGKRAYRRPLSSGTPSSEVEKLLAIFNAVVGQGQTYSQGVEAILLAILNSPHFLYKVETGGSLVAGSSDTYQITQHELAARLSYMAWKSMPDAALMAEADAGRLGTNAQILAQLDRMYSDSVRQAQTRETLARFFRLWLSTSQVPNPSFSVHHSSRESTRRISARR